MTDQSSYRSSCSYHKYTRHDRNLWVDSKVTENWSPMKHPWNEVSAHSQAAGLVVRLSGSPGQEDFLPGQVTFNPLSAKSDQHHISP